MAKCSVSGENFVSFVFCPRVGILTGPDVENIFLKDNLTFVELLRPFSQLYKNVTLRDNNNFPHSVCNLRINFLDASTPPPSPYVACGHLREAVSMCALDQNIALSTYSSGKLSIQVPNSTPWFEAWRHTFVKSLSPSSHEFLGHNLACIFVISTNHPNPVQGFKDLTQRQAEQQNNHPGSYPLWFSSDVIKFYILIHDSSTKIQQTGAIRPEDLYAHVCAAFGSASCFLLPLFATDTSRSEPHYRLPNGNINNIIGHQLYDTHIHVGSSHSDNAGCGKQGVEDKTNQALESADPWLCHLLPHGYYCTPAAAEESKKRSVSRQRRVVVNDPLRDNYDESEDPEEEQPLTESAHNGHAHDQLIKPRHRQLHGRRLSQTDRDRVRALVHEFVNRSLLPWVEKTMRSLNDQVAHRLRLSRSILSATKKFFYSAVGGGGNSSSSSGPPNQQPDSSSASSAAVSRSSSPSNALPPSTAAKQPTVSTTLPSAGLIGRPVDLGGASTLGPAKRAVGVCYTSEAPELQMRRLADLAFLFQLYGLAQQTYTALRNCFQNDTAWLHCAGAQEMAAFSSYLQGSTSQRQYPHHYVDSAVSIYLQTCQSPELALRATLLNAEALCSRGLYNEAAVSLLRLALEDDDLTSGVLIEQSAHCVLHLRRPLLRKFAFRIASAAHRYSRAKQPHLAIRCYKLAHLVFRGRGWSLIEDHMNYTTALQALLTQDLALSVSALRQTLSANSRQSEERQNILLRRYLMVLKNYLSACQPSYRLAQAMLPYHSGYLPEFPLPVINLDRMKVMLGRPTRQRDDLGIEARGLHFSDDDDGDEELEVDDGPDTADRHSVNPVTYAPGSCAAVTIPDWMEGTDMSDHASSSDSDSDVQDGGESVAAERVDWKAHSQQTSVTGATNGQSARRLERLLLSSSYSEGRQLTVPARRRRQARKRLVLLATKRNAGKERTVVPCLEHLTMQLPLVNPMRIPLVLTNLHLLWSLRPSLTSSDAAGSVVVSNDWATTSALQGISANKSEALEAMCAQCRQAVSTETVGEFIMLPDEEKTVELGLFPRQPGELEITALSFDWDHWLPTASDSAPAAGGCAGGAGTCPGSSATPTTARHRQPSGILTVSGVAPPTDDHQGSNVEPGGLTEDGWASTERCSVLGKVPLTVASAVDRPGKDNRLKWLVTQPAPLLDVVFGTFPTRLMHGQLHRLQLTLTNVSHFEALASIRMASTWPGLVAFGPPASVMGGDQSRADQGHTPGIRRVQVACIPATAVLDVPFLATGKEQEAQSGVALLEAGAKTVLAMWLRAPHLMDTRQRHARRLGQSLRRLAAPDLSQPGHPSGSCPRQAGSSRFPSPSVATTSSALNFSLPLIWEQRTISLVFGYQSVNRNPDHPALNCRFVRHHTNVDLYPSVQLEAAVSRCLSPSPGHHRQKEEVGSVLICLRLRNVSISPLKANFSILQVTCASRHWVLTPAISDTAKKPVHIRPGEVASLYLNASAVPTGQGDHHHGDDQQQQQLFSTLTLPTDGDQQQQHQHQLMAHESPLLDFYTRSGTQWYRRRGGDDALRQIHTKPAKGFCRSHVDMDITLIVFWQAIPEVSTNQQAAVLGQSHVKLRHLDRLVCIPPKNDTLLQQQPALCQVPSTPPPPPSAAAGVARPQTLSGETAVALRHRLVELRFSHPRVVLHDFPSCCRSVGLPSAACLRSPLTLNNNQLVLLATPSAGELGGQTGELVPTSSSALATIPLQVELFNPTSSAVAVLLKINDSHDHRQHGFGTGPAGSPEPLPQLQWIGFTNRRLHLAPGGRVSLSGLRVVAPRPGVYDVARCFAAFAKPIDASSEQQQSIVTSAGMVRQALGASSVVLVELAARRGELTASFVPRTLVGPQV